MKYVYAAGDEFWRCLLSANDNQSSIAEMLQRLQPCFYPVVMKCFILCVQALPIAHICAVAWLFEVFTPLFEILAVGLGCY